MSHLLLTAEWAVNEMVVAESPFVDIEAYIDSLALTATQKSVLWLWAWAEQPRIIRHELMPLVGGNLTNAHH